MAIRHGNKTYMQILLDPHRAELLVKMTESLGVRPTGWIRDVIYKELERCIPEEIYSKALNEDKEEWQASIRRRVEGRMRSKKEASEAWHSVDLGFYSDTLSGSKIRPMRYALSLPDNTYLAACYEATGSGIIFTEKAEDACSYVTIEKATSVAHQVRFSLGVVPSVVEEGVKSLLNSLN